MPFLPRILSLALLGGLASLAFPAAAQTIPALTPDSRFSTQGTVSAIAELPGRRLVVGGEFTGVNGVARTNLARLNADGSPDLSWAPDLDNRVRAIAFVPGPDLIYVGGDFTTIDGTTVNGIARFDANTGALDTSWSPVPTANGGPGRTYDLAFFAGFLYACGTFDEFDGKAVNGLVRVEADTGNLDTDWIPNISGPGSSPFITGVEVTSSSVFLAGNIAAVDGFALTGVARIARTVPPKVDTGWTPNPTGNVASIAADGNILYAAGGFTLPGGQNRLARILSNGTPDPAWSALPNSAVSDITLLGNRLFVGGGFTSIGGKAAPGLASLDLPLGALSAVQPPPPGDITSANGRVGTLFASESSGLIAAGNFSVVEGRIAPAIARFDATSLRHDRRFGAQVTETGTVNALAQQPDGKVIVGGAFLAVDGLERRNVARFLADGNLDLTWAPPVSAEVTALAAVGTEIYVAGEFQDVGGQPADHLARFTSRSDLPDPAWQPSLATAPGALLVRDPFIYVGSNVVRRIARSGSGASDPSWTPSGTPVDARALVADGSHLYVGGEDNSVTLARIALGSGDTDPGFSFPTAHGNGNRTTVNALALDATYLYVGGDFDTIGGEAIPNLARIVLSSGGVATGWMPDLSASPAFLAEANALVLDGDQIYVGGNFSTIGGSARQGLARVDTTKFAVADPSWDFPLESTGTVTAMVADAGSLIVGGQFSTISGESRRSFARVSQLEPPRLSFRPSILHINPGAIPGTSHYQITTVQGGFLNLPGQSGATPAGAFVTAAEGAAGLEWNATGPVQSVTVRAAVAPSPTGVGAGSATIDLDVLQPPIVRFVATEFSASEGGIGKATLTLESSGAGTVSFSINPGTATTDDYSPGSPSPITLTGPGTQNFVINITDDSEEESDETFSVRLTGTTGGLTIGSPGTATVTIVDDEIVVAAGDPLVTIAPDAVSPSSGVLKVNLANDGSAGAWRLLGEPGWRASSDDTGPDATGLTTGDYTVEFRTADGRTTPPPLTVAMDGTTSLPVTATGVYGSGSPLAAGNGSLSVDIFPPAVGDAAFVTFRGQWRLAGETKWRDSGTVIDSLASGVYTVEYKGVPQRVAPAEPTILLQAGQLNRTSGIYLFDPSPGGGVLPNALGESPNFSDEPYAFTGQLTTDIGAGSGVVVTPAVVLSAATLLFDDVHLAHASAVHWIFQRHRDLHDTPSLLARGWVRLEGYSSQRADDVVNPSVGPGAPGAAAQALDAAALFFLSDAGRGGASGYLSSDQTPANPWLNGARDKVFVGYPRDGHPSFVPGRMHATNAISVGFAHHTGPIFRTIAFQTGPGSAGAPIFVRADSGALQPAGIYLGRRADSNDIRAIDSTVVDLIGRADDAALTAAVPPKTGGGATFSEAGTTQENFTQGFVTAQISGTDSGRWRIVDANAEPVTQFRPANTLVSIPPGEMMMDFREVAGFERPPMVAATVFNNQTTVIPVTYTQGLDGWLQSELADFGITAEGGPLDDFDKDGIVHLLEFALGLDPRTPSTDGLPTVSVAGNRLTLTYRRRIDPGDLAYVPQFGSDFAKDWQPTTRPEAVSPIDGIWEEVTVEDDATFSPDTPRFGRVFIESSP